jgi:hypothetical protein
MTAPKILLFDLETSPILAWTWGLFKQFISIQQIVKPPRVICWTARWYGTKGKTVMFDSEYKSGHKEMLQSLRDLMDEADVLVGYNSDGFDIPWINQQFLSFGVELPSPYQSIDLYKINKKNLRLPSGKLDYLALDLLGDRKVANRGFGLWIDCIAEEDSPVKAKAWREMERYARKDTWLLEPLFDKLRPFIRSLNYGLFNDTLFACTHCGSGNLQARGYRRTIASVFQRYHCNDCGGWSSDPKRASTTALRPMSN